MKIKNIYNKSLDLSSTGLRESSNLYERQQFNLTLPTGHSAIVDDKWYTLRNIQGALRSGLITITDREEAFRKLRGFNPCCR